ncbi:hypothetical protein FRB90_003397 [Tulasnella sp. 427]|nr:hypothetical protein FRB90_003397 [Tulasnella sp. 427]
MPSKKNQPKEAKKRTCPECGKEFSDRHSKNVHMGSVHAKRIFTCDVCEKGLSSASSLSRHKRDRHKKGDGSGVEHWDDDNSDLWEGNEDDGAAAPLASGQPGPSNPQRGAQEYTWVHYDSNTGRRSDVQSTPIPNTGRMSTAQSAPTAQPSSSARPMLPTTTMSYASPSTATPSMPTTQSMSNAPTMSNAHPIQNFPLAPGLPSASPFAQPSSNAHPPPGFYIPEAQSPSYYLPADFRPPNADPSQGFVWPLEEEQHPPNQDMGNPSFDSYPGPYRSDRGPFS